MKNSLVFIIMILFLGNACTHKKEAASYKYDDFKTINPDFKLNSKAVIDGKLLEDFRCEEKVDGVENSIPLSWSKVPKGANSLAIVMYHYPKKDNKSEINSYVLLWGINPSVSEIPYKMANNPDWYMGPNKDGTAISYTSPCSRGPGEHEYTIALFALSETPNYFLNPILWMLI
ncbi:MAG: hypothetical protein WBM98_14235 [Maribacter sp.]|uniref:hypothetical protein n=1 Tax=Maribacter sp. TaxID=1897614 RepID=UPI003C73E4E8